VGTLHWHICGHQLQKRNTCRQSQGGAPMVDLRPPTPKVEQLLPEKNEGMRVVGQTAAPKEALVGGGAGGGTGGDISPITG
jgi:hypothetical protein